MPPSKKGRGRGRPTQQEALRAAAQGQPTAVVRSHDPVPTPVTPLPAVPPPSSGAAYAEQLPTTEQTPRVSLLRQVTAAQIPVPQAQAPTEIQPHAVAHIAMPEPIPASSAADTSPYMVHSGAGTTSVPQQAHPQAKNLLRRFMEEPTPPTTTFNIVDRLVGSPYANPTIVEREAELEELTRPGLLFALDLAETMIRWGASALEVETSVIAVTTSLGLRHVDVDITNQSVHLNYSPPEGMPASMLRVVRSSSDNYAGLSLVHQMVADITAGRVGLDFARTRLRSIRRRPKPYNKTIVLLAGALFAGLFVLVIGGTPAGALAAIGSGLLVTVVTRLGDRWRIPGFFSLTAGMALVTLGALLLFQLGWLNRPELVVAGGMMLSLPSGRFVSAVQDGINGFPVTAVGRLFSAIITYAAIIAGVMLGAVAADALGMRQLDLAKAPTPPTLPLFVLCLLVAAAVVCGAIVQQVAPRHLLVTAGIAVIGYLIVTAYVSVSGPSPRLAPALAAVAMGLLARWIGLRIGTTALVLAVPAIVILLPGLAIFRSMYSMALDPDSLTGGLAGMFTAFTIIMGIAAGVALGDTLARPFTRDWNAGVRRRIRRR